MPEILVVEDNPGDVVLLRTAFKRSGVVVSMVVVESGEEALALLRDRERVFADMPDLIILDLNLPGIRGTETLKEIKADPTLRSIPVVVWTSSESEEDVRSSREEQANGYTVKPTSIKKLVEFVSEIDSWWLRKLYRNPGTEH